MDSVYRNGGFRGKFRGFQDPLELTVLEGTPNRIDAVGLDYETYVTNIDTYFVCDLIFPVNPTDGLIWETGGSGQGAWIGIRDSGATLRLRGGDGGSAISASGVGVALAETADFPKDGEVHQLAWDFQISTGRVRIFIDGVLKAEGFATDGVFQNNQASGSAAACFLTGPSANITVGESATACNLTDSGSGLRYFANAQIVTGGKFGGMWSMLPKYDDNTHPSGDQMLFANERFTARVNYAPPVVSGKLIQATETDYASTYNVNFGSPMAGDIQIIGLIGRANGPTDLDITSHSKTDLSSGVFGVYDTYKFCKLDTLQSGVVSVTTQARYEHAAFLWTISNAQNAMFSDAVQHQSNTGLISLPQFGVLLAMSYDNNTDVRVTPNVTEVQDSGRVIIRRFGLFNRDDTGASAGHTIVLGGGSKSLATSGADQTGAIIAAITFKANHYGY